MPALFTSRKYRSTREPLSFTGFVQLTAIDSVVMLLFATLCIVGVSHRSASVAALMLTDRPQPRAFRAFSSNEYEVL